MNKEFKDLKVYIMGTQGIPQRFWTKLIPLDDQTEKTLIEHRGFIFSQVKTDYFHSLSKSEAESVLKDIGIKHD